MSEFSIIIVTHNSARDIKDCLESIIEFAGSQTIQIIVIDNASDDATLRLLTTLERQCELEIISSPLNLGFGRACNVAAARATGSILFFCNPDVTVCSDVFRFARQALKDPTVGVFGPRILRRDGTEAGFAFSFPHNPGKLFSSFVRDHLNLSEPDILHVNRRTSSTLIWCDWVLGAALFIRSDYFRRISGFDERFFLYFEDIDLCKRLAESGYAVLADRRAIVRHRFFGSSTSFLRSQVNTFRLQSQIQYYEKHYGALGGLVVRALDTKGFRWRA